MIRALIAMLLILPLTASAFDIDPWTDADVEREVAYNVLLAVDCAQTRYISEHEDEYYEKVSTWALGRHPSKDRVNAYCLLSGLMHAGVKTLLPQTWRPTFDYITIGFEAGIDYQNYRIGIGTVW